MAKYKSKVDFIGEETYKLFIDDIVQFWNPKDYLKIVNDNLIIEMIKELSKLLDIKKCNFGIEGSRILQKSTKISDVDIFIYGVKNSQKLKKNFSKLILNNNFKLYTEKDIKPKLYKLKLSGFGTNNKMAKNQFLKRYYGFYKDVKFSIVCVPDLNEYDYLPIDNKLTANGIFSGYVQVVEDYYSNLIPAKLKVKNNEKIFDLYIYDHYGMNQAKKRDRIYINAKMYSTFDNKLVLTIGFWNKIKTIFNNMEN